MICIVVRRQLENNHDLEDVFLFDDGAFDKGANYYEASSLPARSLCLPLSSAVLDDMMVTTQDARTYTRGIAATFLWLPSEAEEHPRVTPDRQRSPCLGVAALGTARTAAWKHTGRGTSPSLIGCRYQRAWLDNYV